MKRRDVFQAVADPKRRAIISLISRSEKTANSIAEQFKITRQAVSKHLQVLFESELVSQRIEGREIYYQLNPKALIDLYDFVEPYRELWEKRFNQLQKLLDSQETEKKQNAKNKTNKRSRK